MTEPTAENISRAIWEWMGNCWHETMRLSFDEREPQYGFMGGLKGFNKPAAATSCVKCSQPIRPILDNNVFRAIGNPDLTLDENLHLVREAAKRAIEVFGNREFADAMLVVLLSQMEAMMKERLSEDDRDRAMAVIWIMADANQISNAIYNLIKPRWREFASK